MLGNQAKRISERSKTQFFSGNRLGNPLKVFDSNKPGNRKGFPNLGNGFFSQKLFSLSGFVTIENLLRVSEHSETHFFILENLQRVSESVSGKKLGFRTFVNPFGLVSQDTEIFLSALLRVSISFTNHEVIILFVMKCRCESIRLIALSSEIELTSSMSP
jgi:hypothetical protein